VRTHNPTCAYSQSYRSRPGCVFWRAPGRGTRKDSQYTQVCLSWDFSKIPHGSTQYPLFCATVLAIPPSGDISPKVATPLSAPLTVDMFACATSTGHYHRTCRPLYPCHGEHDYPKFSFDLLLMAFYDPVQEYQTAGWSQKITLHHFIMMGETYSRDMYISQYSRALYRIIYHQDRVRSYWNDCRGYPAANPHSNKVAKPTAIALRLPRLCQLPERIEHNINTHIHK